MCRLENTFVQTLPSPLRQPIKPPTCGRGYKVVLYAAAPGHVNNNNYGNVVRQFNEYFLLLHCRESWELFPILASSSHSKTITSYTTSGS